MTPPLPPGGGENADSLVFETMSVTGRSQKKGSPHRETIAWLGFQHLSNGEGGPIFPRAQAPTPRYRIHRPMAPMTPLSASAAGADPIPTAATPRLTLESHSVPTIAPKASRLF